MSNTIYEGVRYDNNKKVNGYLIVDPYNKYWIYPKNNYFTIDGAVETENRCTLDLVRVIP